MDARANDLDTLRSDFYLCLARAFQAPPQPPLFPALQVDLADELDDLAAEIGYDVADDIDDFQQQIAMVPNQGALLQIFSRLFLQPPRAVHINTGVYLDGGLNGGSVMEMDEWYAACGLGRAEEFRDLSDHVAVQLEFVSYLFAHSLSLRLDPQEGQPTRSAGQFLGRFVARWTAAFVADLEESSRQLNFSALPYLPLARILDKAAECDAESFATMSPAQERRERALAKARHKQAEKGVTASDMEEIRRRLAESGLATDHLDQPYESRDAMHGWQRMTPPAPRKR